jgi:hypothetical protein
MASCTAVANRRLEFGHFNAKMFLSFQVEYGFILVGEAEGSDTEAPQDRGHVAHSGRGFAGIIAGANDLSSQRMCTLRSR